MWMPGRVPQVSVRQRETGSDDADVRGGVQVFGWRRNLRPLWFFNSKQSQMIQKHAALTKVLLFEAELHQDESIHQNIQNKRERLSPFFILNADGSTLLS